MPPGCNPVGCGLHDALDGFDSVLVFVIFETRSLLIHSVSFDFHLLGSQFWLNFTSA